jgi:MOSC domain-containing protein YiiM
MPLAKILHLFRAPKPNAPMEELATARALENSGLEGCAHARQGGKRQVLLVDVETLANMNLTPGIVRENITTQGLEVNTLQVGQRLRMGSVLLEVSAVCEPCALMETIRPGLRQELQGRRGMLCRVLSGGTLYCGDAIVLQAGRSALQSDVAS